LELNTEFLFNRRESKSLLAPEPLLFGFFTGNRPGTSIIDIGGDNPFNPYGVDIPGGYIGLVGRRLTEAGNRIFRNNVDNYHFSIGLDGYSEVGS